MMYFGKFCERLICSLYLTIYGNFAPPPANVHKIPPSQDRVNWLILSSPPKKLKIQFLFDTAESL